MTTESTQTRPPEGTWRDSFNAALADRDFYRQAARRYGTHDPLCHVRDTERVCTCGWDDFRRVHLNDW